MQAGRTAGRSGQPVWLQHPVSASLCCVLRSPLGESSGFPWRMLLGSLKINWDKCERALWFLVLPALLNSGCSPAEDERRPLIWKWTLSWCQVEGRLKLCGARRQVQLGFPACALKALHQTFAGKAILPGSLSVLGMFPPVPLGGPFLPSQCVHRLPHGHSVCSRQLPCRTVGSLGGEMASYSCCVPAPSAWLAKMRRLFLHGQMNKLMGCWELGALWLDWKHWEMVGPCMCAKSLQSCPTLCDPMDCSPPGSSVLGILQANTGVGSHALL